MDPMPLDPLLVEVLACPVDKGPLLWFADEDVLYNPRLHKRYDVRDGVPVLLVDEATDVDDAEHERLVAKAATDGVPETGSAGSGGAGGAGG
jgi:uncharacterized protein YbaR (Trm112 family)